MPEPLPSARDLATHRLPVFPGASEAYAQARQALLAEEIEFRRHMTRLAAQ